MPKSSKTASCTAPSSIKYQAASSRITPFFCLLSLRFTGLSASVLSHLFCLLSLCLFMFILLSLYIHIFSASLSISLPFHVPFLSLSCMHIHNQTHSYVLSSSTQWRGPHVPRQIGWSLWVEGRREGKIKEIHTLGPWWCNNSRRPNHLLLCEHLIFLCFHVFLFILFYFLYGLCHMSLIHLLASVFWKLSHVQSAYLYFSAHMCFSRRVWDNGF